MARLATGTSAKTRPTSRRALTGVRMRPELVARVDELARSMDRSRNWLIGKAVEEFVEREKWMLEALDEGIRAADQGKLIPHEKIKRRWKARLAG